MFKKLLPVIALAFVTACAAPEAATTASQCECCKQCECKECCCKDGTCDMCKGKKGKRGPQCPPKDKK